jgi:hypothetical protein
VTVADPRYVPYHWCEDVTPELLVAQRDDLVYLDVQQRNGLVSLDAAGRARFDALYAEASRRASTAGLPGESVG